MNTQNQRQLKAIPFGFPSTIMNNVHFNKSVLYTCCFWECELEEKYKVRIWSKVLIGWLVKDAVIPNL